MHAVVCKAIFFTRSRVKKYTRVCKTIFFTRACVKFYTRARIIHACVKNVEFYTLVCKTSVSFYTRVCKILHA